MILLPHLVYGGKVILRPKFPRSFRIVDFEREGQVLEVLAREKFGLEMLHVCPGSCLALAGEKPLGSSIMNFFGYIYIQDLSSMLPPLFLAPSPSSTVLDLCASPGGKSAILSHLVGEDGYVIANEPNPSRSFTLQKNIERMNILNVGFTSYPGEAFPSVKGGFDYILADVPCSGWGTAEKNPRVMKIWRGKRLDALIFLQREILKRGISLLNPGGRLVYSTCTTNYRENEEQIIWALENFGIEIEPLRPPEGFDVKETLGGALRILGNKYGSQSFFVSSLIKKAREEEVGEREKIYPVRGNMEIIERSDIECMVQEAGLSLDSFPQGSFYKMGKGIFFVGSRSLYPFLEIRGILVGEVKGGNFFPNLFLRKLFSSSPNNKIILEREEEVEGLIKGNSLSFTSSHYKWVNLHLRDMPLALLKVKGHRCLLSR